MWYCVVLCGIVWYCVVLRGMNGKKGRGVGRRSFARLWELEMGDGEMGEGRRSGK